MSERIGTWTCERCRKRVPPDDYHVCYFEPDDTPEYFQPPPAPDKLDTIIALLERLVRLKEIERRDPNDPLDPRD